MLGLFSGERSRRSEQSALMGAGPRRRGTSVRRGHRPLVEGLESRIALATTDVWTGTVSGDWGNASNWTQGVPVTGDSLDFPATATTLATNNTLTAGMTFGSISIDAPGYSMTGSPITLTGGFTATYTGTSTYSLDTTLSASPTPITVGAGRCSTSTECCRGRSR